MDAIMLWIPLKGKVTVVLLLNLLLVSLTLSLEARAEMDGDYEYIQAVAKHPPDQFWTDLTHQAIDSLGLARRFSISWNLKSDGFAKEGMSFILFDSEGARELTGNPYTRNCRYFSRHSIITCDVNTFRLIAESFGIDKNVDVLFGQNSAILRQSHTKYSQEQLAGFYRVLLKWVIGHEFGHVFHRHSGTFSILSEHELMSGKKSAGIANQIGNMTLVNRCHAYERAADDFFASLLSKDEEFEEIYDHLLIILNHAKQGANCPNEPIGYTCAVEQKFHGTGVTLGPGIVTAPVSSTHPALIVRVLDLLDTTWKQKPGDREGGFHSQVRTYRKSSVKLRNMAYSGGICQIKDK